MFLGGLVVRYLVDCRGSGSSEYCGCGGGFVDDSDMCTKPEIELNVPNQRF